MADSRARQVGDLDGTPIVCAGDAAQWEAWLAEHHHEGAGAWLMIAKKHSGVTTVTQPEALDGALCFGWIDSVRRALDETYYLQKYSRRRRGSEWSAINAGRADHLTALGRMREPGQAEIDKARLADRYPTANTQ